MTIEDKLGFTKIRELLAAECTNALAERMVGEMAFSNSYDRVVRELQQTEEFLANEVQPILDANRDILGMNADINV